MDRIKLILIYVSVGLSFGLVRGQQIGNYVCNGSFEETRNPCNAPPPVPYNPVLKCWSAVDTTKNGFVTSHVCYGTVPGNGAGGYQMPRTGRGFVRGTAFILNGGRSYFRNHLRSNLIANKVYCVKFHVNVINPSPFGIDVFGAYFGDNTLDTIMHPAPPLLYLTPQVENQSGKYITDTLNWVAVTGTFTANGSEKFLVIGNYKNDVNTGTVQIQPPYNYVWCDINLDDVSCVEVNLPAYAGSNQLIYAGDSAFIGRQPDFATDSACIWYKLPNMTTAIDTISGLWVKPTVTSTYVVRQELDCSPLKWDTVVVTININYVSVDKLHELSADISLFPNPTSGNLKVSYSGSTDLDITSYVILNSLGQTVRDEFVHDIPVDISTSDLGPGLYEIHFKSRYGILTKKFVRTD